MAEALPGDSIDVLLLVPHEEINACWDAVVARGPSGQERWWPTWTCCGRAEPRQVDLVDEITGT